MSNLREECGVFGVFSGETNHVASTTYYGLFALQHRGQESCGIVVNDDGVFTDYKDTGLVNDVFTPNIIDRLGEGNIAIGHVRYGTTGSSERSNAQPIVVNHIKGKMALAHNGNLINSGELRRELELEGSIFHTTSDTEVISYIITKERLSAPSIEQAVNHAVDRIKGAYSLVIMSPSKLIAVRDENGFRPLCYGITKDGRYIVASESCALDAVGAEFIRDIKPGEIVVFDKNGVRSIEDHCGKAPGALCVFEYIYFARPDSVIDGCSVHSARLRAGAFLALEHPVQADVVIGVPDSGLDAAIGYSRQSGIPYEIGFIKNKYIGRTFIQPSQELREKGVRMKLSAVRSIVRGKRVVLVDDSIVRGTTSRRIVTMLKEAGATEVHVRIASPPMTDPCFYGVDTSTREELISARKNTAGVCEEIGADSLVFLSPESLLKAGSRKELCMACFTGQYPTALYQSPEEANKDVKC